MHNIIMNPIGIIHTPYKNTEDVPIQGTFANNAEGYAELNKKYTKGLLDLDKFSHAILIYYFHLSSREDITGRPFLENIMHGIFAIRSPHRPNHLGMSIVKIKEIMGNRLYFTDVDMFDGTPLIDIKPYIKYFDEPKNTVSGWLENHFRNKNTDSQH